MSEFTLGGYMAKHERAAAFGGSDGQAYSVAIYVDDEPDVRGLYGAALLFVRWSPGGDRPVGHVETEPLAWGRTAGGGRPSGSGALAVRREGRAGRGDRPGAGGVVSRLLGTVLERDGSAYRVATPRGGGPRGAPGQGQARHPARSWSATASGWSPIPPASSTGSSASSPARTLLERRVPEGRGSPPVAANVDQVFVVTATADPDPIPQLIDRLLVVAEANEIAAAVVVNKVDLDPGTALADRFRRGRVRGLSDEREDRRGHRIRSGRAGRPGIGGDRAVRRGEIEPAQRGPAGASAPDRRGQRQDPPRQEHHGLRGDASARRRRLPGGHAGIQRGGALGASTPASSPSCFPEFRPFLGDCRYADCSHRIEPGCRVREAVDGGGSRRTGTRATWTLLAELESAAGGLGVDSGER